LLLAATVAPAQERSRIYSTPAVPSGEVLDRLNLKVGWRTFLGMDGKRDGFFSVQHHNGQLIVQTRSGLVALLDAETGDVLWQARVGQPYQVSVPLGFNSSYILVPRNLALFGLDRRTGNLMWQADLPRILSSQPVGDDEDFFVGTDNTRLYAYSYPLRSEL